MTAFDLAQRYVGIRELGARQDHPLIQWWLSLCGFGTDSPDETPWCSAFANGVAWELRLPRSKSAAARSWLTVGRAVDLREAVAGFDVVILKRGRGAGAEGPETVNAPGHVGFYAGQDPVAGKVHVLGGNQADGVTMATFPAAAVLGVRRLGA